MRFEFRDLFGSWYRAPLGHWKDLDDFRSLFSITDRAILLKGGWYLYVPDYI